MGPDGAPRPPESVGASHGRRRRILPHLQDALEKRPRGQDDADYNQKKINVNMVECKIIVPDGCDRRPAVIYC
jgi:hypothetical protein